MRGGVGDSRGVNNCRNEKNVIGIVMVIPADAALEAADVVEKA